MTRYALIPTPGRAVNDSDLQQVQAYMPANYTANRASMFGGGILITGQDNAGWTLDGYVIPRLASGLIFAREIGADECDVIIDEARATDEMTAAELRGITAPDY